VEMAHPFGCGVKRKAVSNARNIAIEDVLPMF